MPQPVLERKSKNRSKTGNRTNTQWTRIKASTANITTQTQQQQQPGSEEGGVGVWVGREHTSYFALSTCLSLIEIIRFAGLHLLHHVALQLTKRLCTANRVILGGEQLLDRAAKVHVYCTSTCLCTLQPYFLLLWLICPTLHRLTSGIWISSFHSLLLNHSGPKSCCQHSRVLVSTRPHQQSGPSVINVLYETLQKHLNPPASSIPAELEDDWNCSLWVGASLCL